MRVEHCTAVLPSHLKEEEGCNVEASYGNRARCFKLVKMTTVARDLLQPMPANASWPAVGGGVARERERGGERAHK